MIGLARAFDRRGRRGVETVEHGAVLLAFGCTHAQGYGIARPMPADALPDWLALAAVVAWQRQCRALTCAELLPLLARIELQRWDRTPGACLDAARRGRQHAGARHARLPLRPLEINGPRRQRYGTHPVWAKIDAGHEEFHALGAELLATHLAGGG